ncbi:MAG: hypothetical protein LBB74_00965 [Chitinispirillales bacterium]|jgi:hypothetical protein|nr:hypothetical protein [Chitinispirillales bacterium]
MRFLNRQAWLMLLAAAFLAMVLMGCVDGGGNNPDDYDGNGDGAGGIVGDWMLDGEVDYREGEIQVVSFESSGGYVSTGFKRVGNFWIESNMIFDERAVFRYNAVGSKLIVTMGNVWEQEVWQYSISDNKLITTDCYGGDEDRQCSEITYTRVSISDVRRSLGTVYTQNLALKGYWVLQGGDGNDFIRFVHGGPMCYFWGEGRGSYIDADYWYTVGDRLILVDENDPDYTVELTYSVTGAGDDRTLMIGGDTWRIRGRDDSDDTGVQIPPDTFTTDTIPRDTIPIAKRPALFGYRKGK